MKKFNWTRKKNFLKFVVIVVAAMFVMSSASSAALFDMANRTSLLPEMVGESGLENEVDYGSSFINQPYQERPCEVTSVLAEDREWVSFDGDTTSPGTPAEAHVTVSDTTGITIVADFYGFWRDDIDINGITYDDLKMPGATVLHEEGSPMVPLLSEYLEIPHDIDVSIEILASPSATHMGYYVQPAAPPQVPVVFEPWRDNSTWVGAEVNPVLPTVEGPPYSVLFNKSVPLNPVSLEGNVSTLIMRGHRLVVLNLFPVQHNPVTGEITVYSQMVVKVKYSVPAQIEPIREELRSEAFEEIMSNLVINYVSVDATIGPLVARDNTTCAVEVSNDFTSIDNIQGVHYLIITGTELVDPAVNLALWKHQKGIPSLVLTFGSNRDATHIRNAMEVVYETWNPVPTYVLVLGDVEVLPTTYNLQHQAKFQIGLSAPMLMFEPLADNIASDLGYFDLDGAEYFPDMIYSRVSVDDSAQAETFVNKIKNYEQSPPDPTVYPDFYRIMSAAKFEDIGHTGIEDPSFPFVYTMEKIRDYLEYQGVLTDYVYSATDVEPHSPPIEFHTLLDAINSKLIYDSPELRFYDWLDAYDDEAGKNDAKEMIADYINRFLVLYYGHGGTRKNMVYRYDTNGDGWSTDDRDQVNGWLTPWFGTSAIDEIFTNPELTPLVVSIACNTGWFDGEFDEGVLDLNTYYGGTYSYSLNPFDDYARECFAEQITRYSDGGAVAAISSSRLAYSIISSYLLNGLIQAYWPGFLGYDSQPIYDMGAALLFGKLQAAKQWGTLHDDYEVAQTTFEEYHLFGDPETQLWTKAPKEFVVSYPASIGTHAPQRFAVTVTKTSNPYSPVKLAKVCLHKGQNVYEIGYTDANGQVVFEIEPSAGVIELTVTKRGFEPSHGNQITVHDNPNAWIELLDSEAGDEVFSALGGGELWIDFNGYLGPIFDIEYEDGQVWVPLETGWSPSLGDPYYWAEIANGDTRYLNVWVSSGSQSAVSCFQRRNSLDGPDLYLYSQDDSSTWGGRDLIWDNPDIKIFRDGVEKLRLKQGALNDIKVTVHNRGNDLHYTKPAFVSLWQVPFGGGLDEELVGEQIGSTLSIYWLPYGGSTEVTFLNYEAPLTSVCLKVIISPHQDEAFEDIINNVGYENFEVVEMKSPGWKSFDIGQTINSTAYVNVRVKQLGEHGDVWTAMIQDYSWQRIDERDSESIQLYLDPMSPIFEFGRLFQVDLYIDQILVGGMLLESTEEVEPPPEWLYIDGDADLSAQAQQYEWLGFGTIDQPYIIENYNFDVNGADRSCIEIRNILSTYFVVRYCTLTGATVGTLPTSGHSGIYLYNVVGAKVINNVCFGNIWGITLDQSSDCLISDNTCYENAWEGIALGWDSNGNTVSDNTCYDNGYTGIVLGLGSSWNTIVDNVCYGNVYYGIGLGSEADGCTVRRNQCYNNYVGILVKGSANSNDIRDNTCTNNINGIELQGPGSNVEHNTCNDNEIGIFLTNAYGNDIISNTCNYNVFRGIWLLNSNNNEVRENVCNYNGFAGIDVGDSTGNIVTRNTCDGNDQFGIFLYNSHYGFITENICHNNFYTGIRLIVSYGNFIYGNTCDGNDVGIHVESSGMGNAVVENTCNDNGLFGIFLSHSNDNNVTRNTCNYNYYTGIRLEFSDVNVIFENICNENGEAGIALITSNSNFVYGNWCESNDVGIGAGESSNNQIMQNICFRNLDYGILLDNSHDNTVIGNTCNENGWAGIVLYTTGSNELRDNTCNDNGMMGIHVNLSSPDNVVFDNTCSRNGLSGIHLDNSSYNDIVWNTCTENDVAGITTVFSGNNEISDNTCSGNQEYGIHLITSGHDNIVARNTCEDNGFYGIFIDNSYQNFVMDNTCNDNGEDGIHLDSSGRNIVTGNICVGNGLNGILLTNSHENEISGNECSRHSQFGIWLEGSSLNVVTRNTCNESDLVGIFIRYSWENTVTENICNNNVLDGIYLSSSNDNLVVENTCDWNLRRGITLYASHYNEVTGNSVNENGEYGIIIFYGSTNNEIVDNTFNLNDIGVGIENSDSNVVMYNTIAANQIGINVLESSSNIFSHNDIIDNVVQAVDKDSQFGNYWYHPTLLEGNYWSDYLGEDFTGDGIGDTDIPHPAPGYDLYPLVRDWDGDGISDSIERTIGTDPENPDSDFDQWLDGDEVYYLFTDPLVPDPLWPTISGEPLFTLHILAAAESEIAILRAQYLARDLRCIGIEVVVHVLPWQQWIPILTNPEDYGLGRPTPAGPPEWNDDMALYVGFDAAILGIGSNGYIPRLELNSIYNNLNQGYNNPEYEALVAQLQTLNIDWNANWPDPPDLSEEALDIIHQLQEIWAEDQPFWVLWGRDAWESGSDETGWAITLSNHGNEHLAIREVRQAVNLAIWRSLMISNGLTGDWRLHLVQTPMLPTFPGYDSVSDAYRNVLLARVLLHNAGYTDIIIDSDMDGWSDYDEIFTIFTNHLEPGPFLIKGDAQLAEMAAWHGWTGDGSEEHPYIIEGYYIDVNDVDISCIEIWDIVNTYFIIRDCEVTGASGPYADLTPPFIHARAGIFLNNTKYAEVTNNLCYGNCYGIRIDHGYAVTISDNVCYSNNWEGIAVIVDSTLCVVSDNYCYSNFDPGDNLGSGIGCGVGAHNNLIVHNFVYDNPSAGINFYLGYDNIVRDNYCYGNYWGIAVRGWSSGIQVLENQCWDNYMGIYVHNSDSNIIADNDCFLNSFEGIAVNGDSSWNIVTGNECHENLFNGIGVGAGAIGNSIEYNLAYNNGEAGIHFWLGFDNLVRENECYRNYWGIALRGESSGNYILNNICEENTEAGIYLFEVNNNQVSENTITNNPIRLEYSYDNTVSNNVLRGRGIGLINSYHNTVIGNDCQLSLRSGIGLFDSYENIIVDNTCSNNPHSGIYMSNSYSNEVYGNTFSHNTYGIYLIGCSSNEIYHNSIIGNDEQALDEYPVAESFWYSRTLLEGNIWSDYIGVDFDRDGIGDTDIPWPGEGFDLYPLVTDDFDDDGLSYYGELVIGTDPYNDDTDGDFFKDGDEWRFYFTDPLTFNTPQEVSEVLDEDLEELVEEEVLTDKDISPLIKKLDAVRDLMDKDKLFQATQKLTDFISQIESMINSGKLTEEEGNALIAIAQALIDVVLSM